MTALSIKTIVDSAGMTTLPAGLGTVDWAVVAFYGIGLVVLGLAVARRRLTTVDYFLASRASRWPLIGLAMLSSNMSSTALVGLAGGAYAIGIAVYDYEWSAIAVLVFFCLFFLPFVIRSGTFTMPGFLEQRYDGRVRLLFALLTIFLNVAIDSAAVLYSGSLVCQLLLPERSLWTIIPLLAGGAGIYTIVGGLTAVIYTEAVQAFVLIGGALVISLRAFGAAGGWHTVMSRVDPAKLSLIRPLHDPGVPWPGLLLGIPLLGFYYWCTNQTIVQRMLSAENIDQARWGALFAGLLKLPVLFLIVLPGTCALLLYPHLARADLVYPTLILNVLPAGCMGLVVAGFIAATMVSIASMLNSASTLITMDIVRRFRPQLSDRATVRVGRWTTAVLLGVAVAWAPQLARFPSLWQYLQGVLAYAVPPAVAIFAVGLFWRRANAAGATATLVAGSVCGLVLFLMNSVLHWTHFHFLYAAPILTGVDALILIGVSLATRPNTSPFIDATMWHPEFVRSEKRRLSSVPIWQDYRYLAAALLLLTASMVLIFR
jgi:SSS family solute:Na+ symporter